MESTINEEWREIPGFPKYEVSNLGNVRSWQVKGKLPKDDPDKRAAKPRLLKTQPNGGYAQGGYLRAGLCGPQAVKNYFPYVHRLVLETFVGPCPEGMQARHINGDDQDNRLENLRWGTGKENAQDCQRHQTAFFQKGRTGVIKPVLTDEEIIAVHYLKEAGVSLSNTAKALGKHRVTVARYYNGERAYANKVISEHLKAVA